MFELNGMILEIGGGNNPKYRPNLDIRKLDTVDIVCDLNSTFPIESESFDGVYSAYVIEHISWRNVKSFIGEIFRVLRPDGKLVIITANLLEQCARITSKGVIEENDVCMVFGDQNYGGSDWKANAHFTGFSPDSIVNKLNAAGFVNVLVAPLPQCNTDMIVTAKRPKAIQVVQLSHNILTKNDREAAYDIDYFGGGGKFGGYAGMGYADFPVHWLTYNKIMEYKPSSVLELGSARGYVLKRIEDAGVSAIGLEVSKHCVATRVIENIRHWDITEAPWPLPDKSVDLCFSVAVMEHIPETKLDVIVSEINRICNRSVHGISFDSDDFDQTHVTMRDISWWKQRFMNGNHTILDKQCLEDGTILIPDGHGLKLNFGSFTVMFHYGWLNIDILPLGEYARANSYKFMQVDVKQRLPFEDNSVDMIYTSHMLEHLVYDEGLAFLKECVRIMKPNSIIRIITPDTRTLIDAYINQNLVTFDDINKPSNLTKLVSRKLYETLVNNHKMLYDAQSLHAICEDAGFSEIKTMGFRRSDNPKMLIETIDMFPTISLIIECRK